MANESKIGALWKSKSDNLRAPFAKGEIDFQGHKLKVVIFPNGYKKEDRHPDFVVYLDAPKDAPGSTRTAPEGNKPLPPTKSAAVMIFDDEIPF